MEKGEKIQPVYTEQQVDEDVLWEEALNTLDDIKVYLTPGFGDFEWNEDVHRDGNVNTGWDYDHEVKRFWFHVSWNVFSGSERTLQARLDKLTAALGDYYSEIRPQWDRSGILVRSNVLMCVQKSHIQLNEDESNTELLSMILQNVEAEFTFPSWFITNGTLRFMQFIPKQPNNSRKRFIILYHSDAANELLASSLSSPLQRHIAKGFKVIFRLWARPNTQQIEVKIMGHMDPSFDHLMLRRNVEKYASEVLCSYFGTMYEMMSSGMMLRKYADIHQDF